MTGLEGQPGGVRGREHTPDRPDRERAEPLGRGIALGHWAGWPVRAHWSTLLTVGLFAYLLAESELPAREPGRGAGAYWLAGSITSLALLATLLAHELAHAAAARHYGIRVQSVTLWLFGGVTAMDEPRTARADAAVAAAGPLTSLVIGGCATVTAVAVGGRGLAGAALVWLAVVSLALAVFNLLPGAPLDGGRLLRALLWWRYRDRDRAALNAARAGQAVGVGLMVLGFLDVLAGALTGIWLALLGWFVQGAAAVERQSAGFGAVRDVTLDQVMARPAVAPDWWTVRQLVGSLTADTASGLVALVDFSGAADGVVSLTRLERVPPDQRDDVRLREINEVPRDRLLRLGPGATVADSLRELRAGGGVALVVDDAGHPIGVITLAGLGRAAQLARLGLGVDGGRGGVTPRR